MTTETKVKERPIIFSTPMVKGIIAGTKTQTRRVMFPKNPPPVNAKLTYSEENGLAIVHREVMGLPVVSEVFGVWCKYGRIGEHLWVRETFGIIKGYCTHEEMPGCPDEEWDDDFLYLADGEQEGYRKRGRWGGWKPSIHMPRSACRIMLEITGVRVERLNDISEADAKAEGFDAQTCVKFLKKAARYKEPVEAFCAINTNDKENEGWLCRACADKFAGKNGHVTWGCTPESDGPAFCDKCGAPLIISLSKYGIERELFLENENDNTSKYFACTGKDASITCMIADGIGDMRDEHHGRMAQIGFATAWDVINGPGSWKSNPWVWVLEFKRL